MFAVGQKQRIATDFSVVVGASREVGLVRGTLGASKVLFRVWGGNASSLLSPVGARASWDGITNLPVTLAAAQMVISGETTRDVNGLTVANGLIFEARPTGEKYISFPALMFTLASSATTLVTVDAWVFYEVDYQSWNRHITEDVAAFQPLLPA